MWSTISIVLSIIVLYLLYRLVQQGGEPTPTIPRKIFNGIESHVIIVINDDINSMQTVVNTLTRVIGISEKQAVTLLLRIHTEGIAVVWAGDRNAAGQYLIEIQRAGLRCCLTEIA